MNFRQYFDISDELDRQEETIARISSGASLKGSTIWILICAIFIASLGLNVNSTAVIIGAMLISPLMGPIIGMGLAVGINDLELLKRAGKNYLLSTLVAICTAVFYFLISPFLEDGSELVARTSPTFYDVLIAFMGGAAGIIALGIKDKGNVLPGVAIATALMPPLCTAGYGLASGNINFFLGALYLYFINTVFIAISTFIGVRMMKFEPVASYEHKRKLLVNRTLAAIVIITMIPAVYMTFNIVRNSYFRTQMSLFLHTETQWEGTQVVSSHVTKDSVLQLVLVGRNVSESEIERARQSLVYYKPLAGYRLKVIQGPVSDSIMILNHRLTSLTLDDANQAHLLNSELAKNEELTRTLQTYRHYEDMAEAMKKDLRVFFPEVKTLSLSSTLLVHTDQTAAQRCVTAVIDVKKPLPNATQEKLRLWLQDKTEADSLRLVVAGR